MRKNGMGWVTGVRLVAMLLKVVILMVYRPLHALSRCSLITLVLTVRCNV